MIKRILPIYKTGWFYLILLFWGTSYWFISTGGLNIINQANINILNKLSPVKISPSASSLLTSADILSLASSFEEKDVDAIIAALSYHPNSQVTLLGNYSQSFIEKLEKALAAVNRQEKVIIASNSVYSGKTVEIKSSMMFSEVINWFRFSSKTQLNKLDSQSLLYAPLLLNQKQSLPIIWQQDSKLYLSLVGEIIRQLSEENKLSLDEHWQFSLENENNKVISKKLPLGLFTDIYIAANAYKYNLKQFDTLNSRYDFTLLNDELINSVAKLTVNDYLNQQENIYANSPALYKMIIISDNNFYSGKIIEPLLTKISRGEYLYQGLLSKFISWFIALLGFIMLWFIVSLPMKKQAIFLFSYYLLLTVIQYFIYKQQQWLAGQELMFIITGTWAILLAYQKEYDWFLSLVGEAKLSQKSVTETTLSTRNSPKQQKSTHKNLYNSPQNFSPKRNAKTQTYAENSTVVSAKTNAAGTSKENLKQTLVITDKAPKSQATIKKHLTVESFGRYQVEGILGKGAMGVVYQGVDPKINRHVAIKTLQLSDDIDSEEFIEAKSRFFREAQTAGGLNHANIVTIYDVGEENNLGYIAMDLLTGAPLSLFTQPDQLLPTPLVYQLMIQITDALAFAHSQNIVHRDIKPANIIYDDDLLKVTVTDFGIAYVSDNSKTRTGIIMGSPYYMSPEQILGSKVDGRSDIFSLGVTFYQLLCGHLPFAGESIATVAYQITKGKAEAVNQRNNQLPTSALRITNKAMHKDIEKRYQTMAEFRLALANALKRDFKISAS
ncbi:serine/threonine-protein kinase [Colwelliaceae bacterium MEBiC 14330]